MISADVFPARAGVAAYLCCYPADPLQAATQRYALRRHATELGLTAPVVFREQGVWAHGVRPQLWRLVAVAGTGAFPVVFLPDPRLSCLDSPDADDARTHLAGSRCRLLDLPVSCPRRHL
ncbi:hypothetical protein [Streptomyces sp. L2]|uniref:hypothetical protein n=1 Tax=Streptomyces sp. L2 TaxID=2162665 RepID=UPI00101256B9|nr:hypothetical protein [Streptomyces sp. L2]